MQKTKVDKLRELHNDKAMLEQLQTALGRYVYDLAATKALNGEDTNGMKEAKESVNGFFLALNNQYAPKKEKEVESPE